MDLNISLFPLVMMKVIAYKYIILFSLKVFRSWKQSKVSRVASLGPGVRNPPDCPLLQRPGPGLSSIRERPGQGEVHLLGLGQRGLHPGGQVAGADAEARLVC